ncbi:hypothetical protein [Salinivibrio socompensis]|uniref:hypothetical protein n=1 Tax=Salinivibrio socompensis TaxID=1510206 RepID=UPI001F0AAF75|nr:hypothetical protein [Salinivibrio socompensis]
MASACEGINFSGSINGMASEYAVIMEENKPELTEDQWNALYSVYNGYMPSEDANREARLLSWHVSEGYQYDDTVREFLGAKENAVDFINEIKGWSLTKQLSAIYHAKKFWCKNHPDHDELVVS